MEIIEKFRISPPQGPVPGTSSLPLTFFDVIMMDGKPINRCFFFNHPSSTSHFLKSHLPSLKSSLSLTLHHFYPLAGKLRLSPDSHEEQYEIYYKEGDSISFAIAENQRDEFVDVSQTKPHDSAKMKPLVPELNDDLLAIQLTIFPNNGICIAFSINHVACDGFSYTHFVKSWASICNSGSPLPSCMQVPSFDRTALLYSLHECCLGYLKEGIACRNMADQKSRIKTDILNLSSTIFRISREQTEILKRSVHSKAELLEKPLPPYCSAFAVSSAFAWACRVKLCKYPDDQKILFFFTVDWRKRTLEPPVKPTFFGNCVLPVFIEMMAGDLVKDDGVMLACEAFGNKVKELENGIASVIKRGEEEKAKLVAGNPTFIFAGSNRFRLYGADFGWGPPVKVETVYDDEEAFFVADNKDEPGGVEISVVLPKLEMQQYIAIFEESLSSLQSSLSIKSDA